MKICTLALACLGTICFQLSPVCVQPAAAQSNIVDNGSFEERYAGWEFDGGGSWQMNQIAAHGTNFIYLTGGRIAQNLITRPGEDYVLKFARRSQSIQPLVRWDDLVCESFTNAETVSVVWRYEYCHVRATGPTARLTVENPSGLNLGIDDVQVGWLREPITILTQPESRSAVEGGTVAFAVRVSAGPPLFYQWRFNGTAIAGANGQALTLTEVRSSQAGEYSVLVSNAVSSATSASVTLEVETPPRSPLIVGQPTSQTVPAGYGGALSVIALGTSPLSYRWYRGGTLMPGATNATLIFEAVQPADIGSYSVLVSNDHGTSLSLPATLNVIMVTGGGIVNVSNWKLNCPTYDVDGSTRLAGSNYFGQVYAGASPVILRPLGPAKSYRTGLLAGFFDGPAKPLPDVPPYTNAYIQIRAWEAAQGSCYEEARARGGKFGYSEIIVARTQGTPPSPEFVSPRSFSLTAGLPFFTTGRLSSGGELPDGGRKWVLTGAPGFRYLVEKRHPPQDWTPLLVLTNVTGTVEFVDPDAEHSSLKFYRSRMLD